MRALSEEARKAFLSELRRADFREGERVAMTIAEAIRAEGALQSRREILKRQIDHKFGLTEDEDEQIEGTEDTTALDAALDAFADGKDEEAVLALLAERNGERE